MSRESPRSSRSAGMAPRGLAGTAARGTRIRASPLARRIAARSGIDIAGLAGSGPGGRIVRIDVERAAAATDAAAAGANARPVPAETPASVSARACFHLVAECEIDALLALKREIDPLMRDGRGPCVEAFVVKAAAMALAANPEVNLRRDGAAFVPAAHIEIALPGAQGAGAATIRDADTTGIGALSAAIRAAPAETAPQAGLAIESVSDEGIETFAAALSAPYAALLGAGSARRRPVCRGHRIVAATTVSVCLCVDRSAIDRASAARWLAAFKGLVENPMAMLA